VISDQRGGMVGMNREIIEKMGLVLVF